MYTNYSYDNNYANSSSFIKSCLDADPFFSIVVGLIIVAIFVYVIYLWASFIGSLADREGHSFGTWCFFAIIFGLNSYIMLNVALNAEKNNHSFNWWSFWGLLFSLYAFVPLETALIAEKKGYDYTCWLMISMVFSVIALLIACFLPDKVKEKESSVN